MAEQPRHTQFRLGKDLSFLLEAEAQAGGTTLGRLATADLNRYRRMASDAVPRLAARQWSLLSHVLDGAEFRRLMANDDTLPSGGEIAMGIMDWMRAGGSESSPAWARELYDAVRQWPALTIAGVLLHLRAENARKAEQSDDEG